MAELFADEDVAGVQPVEQAGTLRTSETKGTSSMDSNEDSSSAKARKMPIDLQMDLSLPYMDESGALEGDLEPNDPYVDDILLQDDIAGSYPHQLQGITGADTIRSVYNKGAFNAFRRGQEGAPFLESGSYSNLNGMGPDYPGSYPESHSIPRSLDSPHIGSGLPEEGDDDGLFIESMPEIANDSFVSKRYGQSPLGESLREPLSGPRTSPRPFDMPPVRHGSFIRDDEPFPPDMHRGRSTQSYGSLSVFRDGGVSVGSRNYLRSAMTPMEEDGWTRSQSLSRNMDSLGYQRVFPSRSSFSTLRSNSLSRSGVELPLDYEYPARLTSRVASMERLPNDAPGSREYFSARGMPQNRSYVDSLGVLEREDSLPMSRARSMMYLSGEDELDYGFLPAENGRRKPFGSVSDLAAASRGHGMEAKKDDVSLGGKFGKFAKEEKPAEESPIPEWRQRMSNSPKPSREGERREKGHSPRPEEDAEKKSHGKFRFPCRDFEKGVCTRGAACKFYHDPAKGKSGRLVTCSGNDAGCLGWLRK